MTRQKNTTNPFQPEVAQILKKVDALLKKEDVDNARAEIGRAKELDPKNMYIHAYFERVELMLADREKKREADEVHRAAKENKKGLDPLVVQANVDERMKQEEERAAAERKRKLDDEVRRKLEAEVRRTAATPKASPTEGQRPHSAELLEYNNALFKAWERGIPDAESAATLAGLRTSLHIADTEHAEMETAAQRESYIRAFKHLWTNGSGTLQGASTITALHRTFGITPGKFDGLDLSLLQGIRVPKTRPQLVIIDDDAHMLESMAALLRDEGFDARPFTTSDEAFRFLLQSTPDLILADINLESSTIGGFAFFQKLQEIPRLARLPFIFVSGLTDDVVIRTGKSLGADDYLTKPFAGETLLSIIRGKLRRYTELRTLRAN